MWQHPTPCRWQRLLLQPQHYQTNRLLSFLQPLSLVGSLLVRPHWPQRLFSLRRLLCNQFSLKMWSLIQHPFNSFRELQMEVRKVYSHLVLPYSFYLKIVGPSSLLGAHDQKVSIRNSSCAYSNSENGEVTGISNFFYCGPDFLLHSVHVKNFVFCS